MSGASPTFKFISGLSVFGLVLALPSGITAWFDGLPWTGGLETLALTVFIPFLLILGRSFLAMRSPIVFLGILLLFKTVLFFGSPSSGWLIKMHPNLTAEQSVAFMPFELSEEDGWVRTYATLWNKKASGILTTAWKEKLDFPLDWALFGDMGKCGLSSQFCYDALAPIVGFEGVLRLPENSKFALVAEGVEDGSFWATSESGETLQLSPARTFADAGQQPQYQLPKGGIWRISGKFQYQGGAWSLIPVLIDVDGNVTSDLGRDVLWQNAESSAYIGLFKVLSRVVDIGIILFLLIWLGWAARGLVREDILNGPLAAFSLLAISMSLSLTDVFDQVLKVIGLVDPTTASYLGMSITVAGLGFLFWVWWQKDYRNFQPDRVALSVFLLFGSALLVYFSRKWWFSLGQWNLWGVGDDWLSYQFFARKIVVEGEWLRAGEGVFTMRALYRYFVGIYHWLFGQSAFAQHMADVWCVLGATLLLVRWIVERRLSSIVAFIVASVYLAINLIGAFRYHIGRGLVENHAMIFMLLAAWFLFRSRAGGRMTIFWATFFGILAYWTREDHLGAIAGLVFLAYEPLQGATGGWQGYWDRIQLHWERLAWYWGGGILSVLAVCFRNWWLGGDFYPTSTTNPIFRVSTGITIHKAVYSILSAKEWPDFPPALTSLILIPGTFAAFIALFWRPKSLEDYPLSFGIIMIGLFAPYAFLWAGAYPPRYSIHILPLAILSVVFLASKRLERFQVPSH